MARVLQDLLQSQEQALHCSSSMLALQAASLEPEKLSATYLPV